MPWYGWYSAKQERIFGSANYLNKKGDFVCITKISRDPNFNHFYNDSIYQGELTHFFQVRIWNCTKRNRQLAHDNILSTMKYYSNDYNEPKLII